MRCPWTSGLVDHEVQCENEVEFTCENAPPLCRNHRSRCCVPIPPLKVSRNGTVLGEDGRCAGGNCVYMGNDTLCTDCGQ